MTIPQFAADNQHVVVALLYLDFDVYRPTKVFLVLIFAGLYCPDGIFVCIHAYATILTTTFLAYRCD